jgi:hypothetical protein
MGLGGPLVEHDGPCVGLGGPSVEHDGPFMGLGGPSVEHDGPFMGLGGPLVEHDGPFMGLGGPSVEHDGPFMGLGGPPVEHDGPFVGLGGPFANLDGSLPALDVPSTAEACRFADIAAPLTPTGFRSGRGVARRLPSCLSQGKPSKLSRSAGHDVPRTGGVFFVQHGMTVSPRPSEASTTSPFYSRHLRGWYRGCTESCHFSSPWRTS